MDRHLEGIKKYLTALICCMIAVLLDQVTKHLAVIHLKLQKEIVLIPGVFELRYLENQGRHLVCSRIDRYFLSLPLS